MILGMSLATFTAVHVIISLIGIGTGIRVLAGMLTALPLPGWTATFLATTIVTSVTGFLFPTEKVLPSHVVGGISLVVLAVALLALHALRLAGSWRWLYVGSAVVALYLNLVVGVVQAFLKVPALRRLAPTQSQAPFVVVQLVVLGMVVVLAARAVTRFHPVAAIPRH